jgi:hypothetical protein
MNCTNCNTTVTSNYCPDCGQPAKLKRINGHYIQHEIEHVLHFERGLLYTIRELFLRPGQQVRTYLLTNRSRLVKPIIFLLITSLIYSVCSSFFHTEEGYVNYTGAKQSATAAIFRWMQAHYGYANILMGIFIALWTKLFFRKYPFNFFEILILLCFVMGMGMLISTVFAIVQGLIHHDLMQVAGIVMLVYASWAVGQFYEKNKTGGYIKALVAYLLGMLSFGIVTALIGIVADLIIKKHA